MIEATPSIEMPAAEARVSALDFASAMAAWRAWASAAASSLTRKLTLSSEVAPAARLLSIASPSFVRSWTVTVTLFDIW